MGGMSGPLAHLRGRIPSSVCSQCLRDFEMRVRCLSSQGRTPKLAPTPNESQSPRLDSVLRAYKIKRFESAELNTPKVANVLIERDKMKLRRQILSLSPEELNYVLKLLANSKAVNKQFVTHILLVCESESGLLASKDCLASYIMCLIRCKYPLMAIKALSDAVDEGYEVHLKIILELLELFKERKCFSKLAFKSILGICDAETLNCEEFQLLTCQASTFSLQLYDPPSLESVLTAFQNNPESQLKIKLLVSEWKSIIVQIRDLSLQKTISNVLVRENNHNKIMAHGRKVGQASVCADYMAIQAFLGNWTELDRILDKFSPHPDLQYYNKVWYAFFLHPMLYDLAIIEANRHFFAEVMLRKYADSHSDIEVVAACILVLGTCRYNVDTLRLIKAYFVTLSRLSSRQNSKSTHFDTFNTLSRQITKTTQASKEALETNKTHPLVLRGWQTCQLPMCPEIEHILNSCPHGFSDMLKNCRSASEMAWLLTTCSHWLSQRSRSMKHSVKTIVENSSELSEAQRSTFLQYLSDLFRISYAAKADLDRQTR